MHCFQNYLVPQMGIFADKWHNMRLYGEIMLILLTGIVAVGVKLVSSGFTSESEIEAPAQNWSTILNSHNRDIMIS